MQWCLAQGREDLVEEHDCCFKILKDWEEHGMSLLRIQQGSMGGNFQMQIPGWMWMVVF